MDTTGTVSAVAGRVMTVQQDTVVVTVGGVVVGEMVDKDRVTDEVV